MAGGGSRASWVMVKGARRCGWWWLHVSGFVVVVVCGWLSSLLPWAVTLWALVVVHVGVVVGLVVVHASWLVVVCGQLWLWL